MPNADPNDPFIGKKLGNYRIERKLGEGGMGVVYLAMHLVFGSRVAVKILPPLIASDAEKRTRFFLEAEAAYRLRHPNIISALDAGQDELTRQCYFVMELCEGQSLRALLKESGPWPLARAMPLFRGLLDGMACAHDAGIIHRDIKPDNVMLEPDGRPRLADFGLARDLANDNRLTTSGMVFGTPHYMPPEQWKGENIDARSDQYALGVVFMEVLSGELPVKGSTPTALLSRLLAGDVTRLSQLPVSRSLPGLLVQAVERMCELDASRRFADIAAVRAALSALHVDDASGGTGVTYATLMEFGPSASAPPVQPRAPATMPGSFDGIAVERRTEEGSLMATMPGRRVDPPAPPGLLPDQPARGRAALVGVIVLLLACVGVVVAMASSAAPPAVTHDTGGDGAPADRAGSNESSAQPAAVGPDAPDGDPDAATLDQLLTEIHRATSIDAMNAVRARLVVLGETQPALASRIEAALGELDPRIRRATIERGVRELLARHESPAADESLLTDVRAFIKQYPEAAGQLDELANQLAAAPTAGPEHDGFAGFTWLREERFAAGAMQVYRHDLFAAALGLRTDATDIACEFVLLPAARVRIGDDGDRVAAPAHNVDLPSFLVARTELTQAVWDGVTRLQTLTPQDARSGARGERLPMHSIRAVDLDAFLAATGLRLPSEAEWEHAARAGTTTRYWWGDDEGAVAAHGHVLESSGDQLHAVGTVESDPNPFGLFDTAGNVWEACADSWHSSYAGAPTDGSPLVEAGSGRRVRRGGGYNTYARSCHPRYRSAWSAEPSSSVGIRPVASASRSR